MNLACFAFVALTICCVVAMADQITEPHCYWDGTSPICQGSCNTGEFVASTSKFGDGKTCVTGLKKYCCKMPAEWLAQLSHLSFFGFLNNNAHNAALNKGF